MYKLNQRHVRDIVLLPEEFRSENGSICIPRSTRREKLGKAGLVGKIEITSSMTEDEVRSEICEVFAVPMGLTVEDIKNGTRFQFSYLLRSGCNSRTLCVPTVKDTFQWNGKQVASLAKSGSFIYLLAREPLPAWVSFYASPYFQLSDEVISDDEDDNDLVPVPKRFFSARFV